MILIDCIWKNDISYRKLLLPQAYVRLYHTDDCFKYFCCILWNLVNIIKNQQKQKILFTYRTPTLVVYL